MDKTQFPLLFLSSSPQVQGFTSVQSGGSQIDFPPRNRSSHAKYLKKQLSIAWQAAENRKAVAKATREGCYLEFAGAPDFELSVKSLENRQVGIRLLNIRKEIVEGKERKLATIYVPSAKSSFFIKKIRAYEKDNTKAGKAKNKSLVESIDDIREALLSSFWTDPRPLIGDKPDWIEAWILSNSTEALNRFRLVLKKLEIDEHAHQPELNFPERTVLLIKADRKKLARLIEHTEYLAELRLAQIVASKVLSKTSRQQADLAKKLLARCIIEKNSQVSVCVLDQGVNRGHLLLEPLIADDDLHAVRDEWGTNDSEGHGTLMAGTVAYGDFLEVLYSDQSVHLLHRIESSKILPPPPNKNPKHLWGAIMAQGISRPEIHASDKFRIICMAVTAEETGGNPSSWSGEVDQLTSGAQDDKQRLFLVSAGNIRDQNEWKNYPISNVSKAIQDPAQAWNAVTVGAFTNKTRIEDPNLSGYTPLAPAGGLSPFSSTSRSWKKSWPIKPEVVFEGGNVARTPNGGIFAADDLKLISTSPEPQLAPFSEFDATSAATAQAARMAAIIRVSYPEAWPETIRGLMIHSADWTSTMKQQFLTDETKASYENLLRMCGYGVPKLDQALYCLRNSLTLIKQSSLQPFDKKKGVLKTRDMHLYSLPWPLEVLLQMGETPIEMKVTLSYFIEPSPGEVGWKDRYRYSSHGLRFDLNSPGEEEDHFVKRINQQAREEDEGHPGTDSPSDHWTLGKQRDVGSIHSDIWKGRAADLATSHLIAVHPSIGWWRERPHLDRWNRSCRYSLIVSIRAPNQEVDIYTPVAVKIGIPNPIPVEIQYR